MEFTSRSPHLDRQPAGFLQQAWLLCDKNWKTKGRFDKKSLILEMSLPIILLVGLLLMFNTAASIFPGIKPAEHSHEQLVSTETPTNIFDSDLDLTGRDVNDKSGWVSQNFYWYTSRIKATKEHLQGGKSLKRKRRYLHEWEIYIAPDNNFTREFANTMVFMWVEGNPTAPKLSFRFQKSEDALQEYYSQLRTPEFLGDHASHPENFKLGLVLPSVLPAPGSGKPFTYKIRINPRAKRTPPVPKDRVAPPTICRSEPGTHYDKLQNESCPVNDYLFSDFLALQAIVEQAVIRQNILAVHPQNSGKLKMNISMEGFPKDSYEETLYAGLRSGILLISFVPISRIIHSLLVYIVTDKIEGVKDGLQMVGFSDIAYWLSWVGTYGVHITVFSILYSCYLCALVLPKMAIGLLFLLYFLFGLSVIMASFALSPLFDKPKTAGVTGSWLTRVQQYLILIPIALEDPLISRYLVPLNLFSPYAFTRGLDASMKHYGVEWSDLKIGGKGETVLFSLAFLAMDNLLYAMLALYLDNVLPSEYGIKKHPLFFLRIFGYFKYRERGHYTQEEDLKSDDVEEPSGELKGKEAIKIHGICKSYLNCCSRKRNDVLKGINLTIYPGQITAILGRNGVGKTTLFSIITGRTSANSGTVSIYDLKIERSCDVKKLRKLIGVCFQHDLHFRALTVEEHLKFYGKLRGMKLGELDAQIEEILVQLKLDGVRYSTSTSLSTAEQRKLSVAMALIGDPPIILFDEPSAGLDPVSRRELWSVLRHHRKGKVILLTTHFMDEADILADRKAIMHEGKISCVGSSLFLKNRFGEGYRLTVELSNRNGDTGVSDEIVGKSIPSAVQSKKIAAAEVCYALPHAETLQFEKLFADIEAEVSTGGRVKSFGVCMTTLEEVFIAVTAEGSKIPRREINLIHHENMKMRRRLSSTYWAFCWIRMKRLRRSLLYSFLLIVVPFFLTAAGLAGLKEIAHHDVNVSNPNEAYKDFRIAVKEPRAFFQNFLKTIGVSVTFYSGNFTDLLLLSKKGETLAAAVNIQDEDYENDPPSISALMRINGTFLHAPTIVLDLICKHFASQVISGNWTNQRIITQLIPAPLSQTSTKGFSSLTEAFSAILILSGAFVLTSSGLLVEIIHDREVRVRDQLRLHQVSMLMYYLPLFSVFGFIAICVIVGEVLLIAAFQLEIFPIKTLVAVVILLIIHTVPCMLANAIFSYAFDNAAQAEIAFIPLALQSANVFIFTLAGVDFSTLVLFQKNEILRSIILNFVNIFLASINVFYIPSAVLYWMLRKNLEVQGVISSKQTEKVITVGLYFSPQVIQLIIVMACQSVVFTLILIIIDFVKFKTGSLPQLKCKMCKNKVDFVRKDQLEDVLLEHDRVESYFKNKDYDQNCILAVKDLHKRYGKFKAVDGVSFMIDKGEVLVIVGHSGAGKTTTMKLITAEEAPYYGKVRLCGRPMFSCCTNSLSNLGFCPQHNPLWDNITLKEHIQFYTTLRGVPAHRLQNVVSDYIKALSIEEYENEYAQSLSGGTKRKLTYSIATSGSPKIVLMDEPTTGMDPQSTRILWSTILGTFKDSRSALLTTHSMDEADALSTRIAIMMKGKIVCIGTPHYLKTTYGQGYTLELKLSQKDREYEDGGSERKQRQHRRRHHHGSTDDNCLPIPPEYHFVVDRFPDSCLLEWDGNRAMFSAQIKSISKAFGILEEWKASAVIEEYSLSQTTLEQIFLQFASESDADESKQSV